MTSRNVFKFAVTLTLVFAVAGACALFPAKASMESSAVGRGVNPPSGPSAPKVLQKTYFLSGSSGASIPVATFTKIDGGTINCPGLPGSSCTYAIDEWLQVDPSASTQWALVSEIDGNFIGVGPYLGTIAPGYSAGSWSENTQTPAAVGNHTIGTYVYMLSNTGTAEWYAFNYHVYKP
jgi:hypothetical protein